MIHHRVSISTFGFLQVQILKRLQHPNVLKFMGLILDKENQMCFLVGPSALFARLGSLLEPSLSFPSDYIAGGTLKNVIHDLNIPLSWLQRLRYAKDIAAGMVKIPSPR